MKKENLYSSKEIAVALGSSLSRISQLLARKGIEPVRKGEKNLKLYSQEAYDFCEEYIKNRDSNELIVDGKRYMTAIGLSELLGCSDDSIRNYARNRLISPEIELYDKKWFNVEEATKAIEERKKSVKFNIKNPMSKCWNCLKANDFGCVYFKSRYKRLVKGSKAVHPKDGYGMEIKNAWIVTACPEFKERYYKGKDGKMHSRPLLPECIKGREERVGSDAVINAFQSLFKLG